jgi:hypothetical protein
VGRLQHFGRVAAPVGGIVVGKEFADVAEGRRPEEGVGDRVEQDVGVAVADGPPVVRE